MKILEDGSVESQTFSGPNYKGEYPSPKEGEETYEEYYERCQVLKDQGFHLGDLSWSDWQYYCWIDAKVWGSGLTTLGALVTGILQYKKHNK